MDLGISVTAHVYKSYLKPNVSTLTTLIDEFLRQTRVDEGEEICSKMTV